MADPVNRTAARLAALVSVPVALVAGVVVYLVLQDRAEEEPEAAGPASPPASSAPAPAATGPVDMDVRELTAREEVVCRALLSQLPGTVREAAQRPVTAGPEQNAAYGDPPLTVACGVPPADYALTDRVWSLAGDVCWHSTGQPDGGTVWVTVDREVPVAVSVPAAYDPPGAWVTVVSGTVAETVLSGGDPPSGCR